MEKRPCISVGQIFSMLFVSRMVITMTYGTLLIGDSDIWDHLISAILSLSITFLLILPIYKLYILDTKMNILDNLRDLMGKLGYFFILIYVLYFLIITLHTLSIFDNFVANCINPPISVRLLCIFMLFSACYGAYKGLEALSRASSFIFIATVLALIFMFSSLISSVETINFRPLVYENYSSVTEGILYMISQSSCLVALGILLPMATGSSRKKFAGIILWNIGVYVSFVLMIILITGAMGEFVSTQLFPVYTATSIGKFGAFRHLDSLYLGIWMAGIFLKTSLFLLLASEGIKKIWGEKIRKISILIMSILLSICVFFINNFSILKKNSITVFLITFLIFNIILIPIILIILKNKKISKGSKIFEK